MRPAQRDLAFLALRHGVAVLVHQQEFLMLGGRADGAVLLGVMPVAADPAAFGAAEELQQIDAVGFLELLPALVGMPAEKVISYFLIQSKNRLCEKRRAICRVQPVSSHGISDRPCGEFHPNERYSSVLSSSVRPSWSMVERPNDQCAR